MEVVVSSVYIIVGLAFLTAGASAYLWPGNQHQRGPLPGGHRIYTALFDKVLDTLTALGHRDLTDQAYRTVALPLFYAIAPALRTTRSLQCPAPRQQNQRSTICAFCFFTVAFIQSRGWNHQLYRPDGLRHCRVGAAWRLTHDRGASPGAQRRPA
ncbi:MAG: hypothetical protein R2706_10890 [Acidimicrobiales bacterium]